MLGNVDNLHHEADRKHRDADSKTKEAEKLEQSAQMHQQAGDETKAQMELDSAAKLRREADEAENLANSYNVDAVTREKKAQDIDKEIERLQLDFDKQIRALEDKKKTLLG